jgi:hypothetical protein
LGNTSKPFVLPQEDPLFDETNSEEFNVPEFTKEPVRTSMQALIKAAFSRPIIQERCFNDIDFQL